MRYEGERGVDDARRLESRRFATDGFGGAISSQIADGPRRMVSLQGENAIRQLIHIGVKTRHLVFEDNKPLVHGGDGRLEGRKVRADRRRNRLLLTH